METGAIKTPPPKSKKRANAETEPPDRRLSGASVRTDCLNCGADRVGPFCQNCGQKYLDAPLTYWALGKAFVDRVLDLDQGYCTRFGAWRRPGRGFA